MARNIGDLISRSKAKSGGERRKGAPANASRLGRIKGISPHTARLLRDGEGQRADFKRSVEGISNDDLVAFANSDGGSILAGIDEKGVAPAAQTGVIVGCDVSDAAILQITNKAISCFPPVAIDVRIENLGKTPFLRIDVLPSPTKPHCTPKGIYCKRDGNRNRPLHPSELLKIFIESESRAFAERFESAAIAITAELADLQSTLESSIDAMGSKLGWAEYKLNDTESTLDSVNAYAQRINSEIGDLTARMRALFHQDKRQDPIYDRERKKLLDEVVAQLVKDKDLYRRIKAGNSISMQVKGKAVEELTREGLSLVVREAVTIVDGQLERAKYSLQTTKPAEFGDRELREVSELITEGGEVADGVEQRLKGAHALGLVRFEKAIVGVAALKRPSLNYRTAVFEKANATLAPNSYPRELGWIFLKKAHRSKGQVQPLIESILRTSGTHGVFATTRVSNDKMQRILVHQGFSRHGDAYPSVQNPGEELVLYIRPGSRHAQAPITGD